MTQKPTFHLRWMIRRDMPEVLEIERLCFEYPWSEDSFMRCLRQRNCIGMVVEHTKSEQVVAFVIYELHKTRLHVLNLAVAPAWQRKGVGALIVNKLKLKLHSQRRTRILLEVRESNVDAQLFFRAQGFRAVSVLRDFYVGVSEDAYLMQFRHVPVANELTEQEA